MASLSRPQARRGPSGAWTRLKPAVIDPLDVYGLPSKGETRLHNYKTQEDYYQKIVDRYMKFIASSGSGEELERAFAAMAVKDNPPIPVTRSTADRDRPPLPRQTSTTPRPNDMPNILMAMRKLREGLLGSHRRDHFAQRAYIFIIQASILSRHWESYQPALLYLLHEIHPVTALSPLELQDFAGYRVLDLACRQYELVDAFAVRHAFKLDDRRVSVVLMSLVHDDWVRFWRTKRVVDGYQRAIMDFAVDRMRLHALKCLGRGYLNADKSFIERTGDATWPELVRGGVGWQLQDGGNVMIRKPKTK
ncbi:hypothetical protein LTR91_021426 [Friedmanniomyces endolithicus]|uniref:CSN8/PSMD8/EIF3K domain-containing protein n=1 Tax=Friedmanniomyces endolithicus TaxID=329885 RepID=A0AAN6HA76_9PEZI|nr:hypothetical protein LTR94_017146 [Friedmanniomyces endolithicus]KAK0773022.1 hypothetical protein LTR59_015426 [Friedmanniomyces endolithicus]KAK0783711.1 hypothetical protein LTR75_014062 [Friedmanniomyces endolithicus]KAK0818699.1 hypothetical protein LTR38_000796 [Friedmanniomyces endolithicus]KAK0835149.1 hypothetical protein LTR03_014208 [Friedmanniomyces endolithicus]